MASSTDEGGAVGSDVPVSWTRDLFDTLHNDLVVYLRGGRILDINANGLKMLGLVNPDQALDRKSGV